MSTPSNKLFTILGLGAVVTFLLPHFLNVSRNAPKDSRGNWPQTISDSNKNVFDGPFQPALININININSDNR